MNPIIPTVQQFVIYSRYPGPSSAVYVHSFRDGIVVSFISINLILHNVLTLILESTESLFVHDVNTKNFGSSLSSQAMAFFNPKD